jgi:hypothetical protein
MFSFIHRTRANVLQVSSTESGVIFGNIIWESGTTETCVVLSDIHVDIMDYIKSATCTEQQVHFYPLCFCMPLMILLSSEACGPNSNGKIA